MRKVLVVLAIAGSWTAMSLGASAPAGLGPDGPATISVSEGVVGTTVTVTGTDCGLPDNNLRANGTPLPQYQLDTGVLFVTVPGWPAPFDMGFQGGTNNIDGVATATFQVPDVALGAYAITVECQSNNPGLGAGLGSEATPFAIGTYPGTLSFTVIAPAATVPVVEAQATTTG